MKIWSKPTLKHLNNSINSGSVCFPNYEGIGGYIFNAQATNTCIGAYAPGPNLNQADSSAFLSELTPLTPSKTWSGSTACAAGLFIVPSTFCS